MKVNLNSRRTRAALSAELGPCLWLLLILFVFPLIDLGTIAARTATVYTVAREAARAAGRAETFSASSSSGPSSKQIAVTRALQAAQGLPQATITAQNVTVYLVGTPIVTGSVNPAIRQTTPLTAPADTADYLYEIEVDVTGTVNPLVMLSSSTFGTVPGLTAPFTVRAIGREVVEHPSGLTQ